MRKLLSIFAPNTDGAVLIDPFAGSGTTLVAAKQASIDYIGIEIEPSYIDIIEKRLNYSNDLQKTLSLF